MSGNPNEFYSQEEKEAMADELMDALENAQGDTHEYLITREQSLPHAVWCVCGHISGQHGAKYPHPCACDGNRWINGHGSICNCHGFFAKTEPPEILREDEIPF